MYFFFKIMSDADISWVNVYLENLKQTFNVANEIKIEICVKVGTV